MAARVKVRKSQLTLKEKQSLMTAGKRAAHQEQPNLRLPHSSRGQERSRSNRSLLEKINPSSVKLNVKARTIPGQLENPLEVVSPVEIEFSGSANGVARFIIGYDATPGLTIDRVWYRYNV
ncbi:hypothetical protein R3P38DRAFT_2811137 [Favolaschia claudopus]|uniref:Uncharacterized protein n=1 Tax=Favolaschia claudopus TaxID=2862362 RepID=A0AAV9Z9Q5_9AGAR